MTVEHICKNCGREAEGFRAVKVDEEPWIVVCDDCWDSLRRCSDYG